MKIMKKYVAIAAAAILLAGVVYFSCSLNKGKKPVNADADAMPQATGDSVAANENFFEAFREERESTRSLEIEYLDEIIAASANDSETLKDATEQKLRLVANMEAEFSAESMIRAKGFSDAAVTFHKGSVNVVIATEELSSEEVAQILDIVKRETGEKTENIKIMAGGIKRKIYVNCAGVRAYDAFQDQKYLV